MIESRVIAYLSEQFQIPVVAEVPKDKPAKFLLVERTGRAVIDHIKQANIAVQSWSSVSLADAADLCDEVELIMSGLINDDSIAKCTLENSYNFTDITTKTYRYQAVFNIVYY